MWGTAWNKEACHAVPFWPGFISVWVAYLETRELWISDKIQVKHLEEIAHRWQAINGLTVHCKAGIWKCDKVSSESARDQCPHTAGDHFWGLDLGFSAFLNQGQPQCALTCSSVQTRHYKAKGSVQYFLEETHMGFFRSRGIKAHISWEQKFFFLQLGGQIKLSLH